MNITTTMGGKMSELLQKEKRRQQTPHLKTWLLYNIYFIRYPPLHHYLSNPGTPKWIHETKSDRRHPSLTLSTSLQTESELQMHRQRLQSWLEVASWLRSLTGRHLHQRLHVKVVRVKIEKVNIRGWLLDNWDRKRKKETLPRNHNSEKTLTK